MARTLEIVNQAIKKLFKVHPYMNNEIGDKPGRDKYKSGYDKYVEYYGDLHFISIPYFISHIKQAGQAGSGFYSLTLK